MARVEINETVQDRAGNALADRSVQVNVRGSSAATVYAAATGSTTVANPLTTSATGQVTGWVEEGSYDLVVEGVTTAYEAVSGATVKALAAGGGGAVSPGGVVYASSYGVSTSATGAENAVALEAALAATPAGGTLVLDFVGTASVLLTSAANGTSIQVTKSVTIEGLGGTTLKFGPESSELLLTGFLMGNGVTLRLRSVVLEGPDATGASTGTFTTVQSVSATGLLYAEDCHLRLHTFGPRHGGGVAITDFAIELHRCVIEGYNDSEQSGGVMLPTYSTGAPGTKRVVLRDCRFMKHGRSGTNQDHHVYVPNDADLDVSGCRFTELHGSGYAIHIYETGTVAGNEARSVKIVNCYFQTTGSGAGTGDYAVVTNKFAPTQIIGCTIDATGTGRALEIHGDCLISDCVFLGGDDGEYYIKDDGSVSGYNLVVQNSYFEVNAYQTFYMQATPAYLMFKGNVFAGIGSVAHQIAISTTDGGTQHCAIVGNHFIHSGNYYCVGFVDTQYLDYCDVRENQFSHGGTSVRDLTSIGSTTLTVANNYGIRTWA